MAGRLIERLFVEIDADLTRLGQQLNQGVTKTKTSTQLMARQWEMVSTSIEGLTSDLSAGLITHDRYMSKLNSHAASIRNLGVSYDEAKRKVHGFAQSLRHAETGQMGPRVAGGTGARPGLGLERDSFGRSLGQQRMQAINLGYQLQDIWMGLATGQGAFMVGAQQGSQLTQIYAGQGGIGAAMRDITKILKGLRALGAAAAASASGLVILNRKIGEGLPESVTFGDRMKGVGRVGLGAVASMTAGPRAVTDEASTAAGDAIASGFSTVYDEMVKSSFMGMVAVAEAYDLAPNIKQEFEAEMNNMGVSIKEGIANAFLRLTDTSVIEHNLNRLLGTSFDAKPHEPVEFDRMVTTNPFEEYKRRLGFAARFIDQEDPSEDMMGVFREQSIEAAKARLKAALEEGEMDAEEFEAAIAELNKSMQEDFEETAQTVYDLDQAIKNATGGIKLGSGSPEINIGGRARGGMVMPGTSFVAGEEGPELITNSGSGSMSVSTAGQTNSMVSRNSSFRFGVTGMNNPELIEALKVAMTELRDEMERVGETSQEVSEQVKRMAEEIDSSLGRAADNMARVFGNAFEKLATTGKLTFSDLVKGFNQLVIQSTSQVLQKELANIFKNLLSSFSPSFGGFFSNLFAGGIGRARGGVEMPWRNFVAGEEGPELISQDGPAGARRVMTAGRTRSRGMMMPQPVVVNQYIQTPDVESFRQSQGQLSSRATLFLSQGRRNQ